jgi:hypothetical protein
MRIEPGDTHSISDDAYADGAAWLLDKAEGGRRRAWDETTQSPRLPPDA